MTFYAEDEMKSEKSLTEFTVMCYIHFRKSTAGMFAK